jgi:RNA-directed DNA polymerase
MNQRHPTYKDIHTKQNLDRSWNLVKRNHGSHGIDRKTIQDTEKEWDTISSSIQRRMENHTYAPQPVRRVYIPKPNGKKRPIGIPTVIDRIVQQAIRCVIEPSIDEVFEECSYGFRPGKSAHQALRAVYKALTEEKLRWIIQIDLGSFFDTIPHELIVRKLQEHNVDEEIIRLIKGFLGVGVMEDGTTRYSTTGTPQGGVISPLLANIVLDEVDTYVTSHGGERIVRYADDFVICAKTRRRSVHVYKEVVAVLTKLGLVVNEEKSTIVHLSDTFTFLGYTFGGGRYYEGEGGRHIGTIWKRPSDKAINAFKDNIRFLTRRQQPRNIKMLAPRLNSTVRGWFNYFHAGRNKSRYAGIDSWIRMRLRSFIHKKKSYLDNAQYPNSFFKESGYAFLSDVLMSYKPKPVQGTLRF